jgi:hypothetical protein
MDLGILADNESINPKGLGILQAGLGMLAAGGPSRMPVSLGQAVGQAGQQGMNAYQQAIVQQRQLQQLAMQKALQDAQIKRFTADAEKDQAAIRSQQLEREFYSNPEIRQLLSEGKLDQVIARHPNPSQQTLMGLAELKNKGAQSIGSGGLRLPDGTVIPPAPRPNTDPKDKWGEPYVGANGEVLQKNETNGQIRQVVTRPPQTHITQPAPVTPVTIQDPNDPNATVVIDGRTRQVLGKGPKLTETGRDNQKLSMATKQDQANAVKALKAAGYDPLTGKDKISELIEQSTSGFAQRIGAEGLAAFNVATPGRKALNTVQSAANTIVMDMMGGKLGAGISNADREFIVSQLGDVGNANKTSEERLAAWNYAKNRMIEVGLLPKGGQVTNAPSTPNAPKPSGGWSVER